MPGLEAHGSRTSRIAVTVALTTVTFLVLGIDYLHKKGVGESLPQWASTAAAETQAPNPVAFMKRALHGAQACFGRVRCDPDGNRGDVENPPGFIGVIVLGAAMTGVDYALRGVTGSGVFARYGAVMVFVIAGIVSFGLVRSNDSGPNMLAFLFTISAVAIVGGGVFLWLLALVLRGVYTVIGGFGSVIVFVAAHSIAFHLALTFVGSGHELRGALRVRAG